MSNNILKNLCLASIFGVATVDALAKDPFVAILAMGGMFWFCSRALKDYFDAAEKEYQQTMANIQALDAQNRRGMILFYKVCRADEDARLINNVATLTHPVRDDLHSLVPQLDLFLKLNRCKE